MNGFVEFTFAMMWEYTKLTFRIFLWLTRWIVYWTSVILNRRQAARPTLKGKQADLFETSKK